VQHINYIILLAEFLTLITLTFLSAIQANATLAFMLIGIITSILEV